MLGTRERGERRWKSANRAAHPSWSLESRCFGSSWKSVSIVAFTILVTWLDIVSVMILKTKVVFKQTISQFARCLVLHFNPILQRRRRRLMRGRRERICHHLMDDHTIQIKTTAIGVVSVAVVLNVRNHACSGGRCGGGQAGGAGCWRDKLCRSTSCHESKSRLFRLLVL